MKVKDNPYHKKRPTQGNVAKLANVSQAMVSYVINDTPSISIPEETRKRVLDAVRTLGYVPDSAARSLRTRKSFTVAGIIPDITNPFYPAFERGIQDVAETRGYDLITCNTDGMAAKERTYLRLAQQGRVDGFVAVFFHMTVAHLRPLLERGVAMVRFESTARRTGSLPLDNIYVDNIAAARAATSHLVEHGHRTIAMLAGQGGPQQSRVQGYRPALINHGITVDETMIQGRGFQEDDGYDARRAHLGRTPRPTAVFATNDVVAMGAFRALRDAGLRVPDDIAIVERLDGTVAGGRRSEFMSHELIIRESVWCDPVAHGSRTQISGNHHQRGRHVRPGYLARQGEVMFRGDQQITVGLVVSLAVCNEFLLATVFLTEQDKFTIVTSYQNFTTQFSRDWSLTSAAAVMMIAPILVIFLVFQRRFIEGMTQGGMKG